jgi:hypothetical protein
LPAGAIRALDVSVAAEEIPMEPNELGAWGVDWAWGLPLIIVTVVFHAYGLSLIHKGIFPKLRKASSSAFVVGRAALAATVLHALEVICWAIIYRLVGAIPNNRSAVLYSLNALTSYGHVDIQLAAHWSLLGALEALNGWILFGLTTAFLFTVFQRVWLNSTE